jgi:hypothetical protein
MLPGSTIPLARELRMVRSECLPGVRLLLLLAAVLCLLPAQTFAQSASRDRIAVDLELVLAIDVSLSIDAREARLQRDGYVAAFRDPQVLEAIKGGILGRIAVTYFEWAHSSHSRIIAGWTLIDSDAAAEAFAAVLQGREPGPAHYTSISGAIDFGAKLFADNGFEGTRQVIDISGDGPNNWGDLVHHARDRAVAQGLTINGLPILDEGPGPFGRYNIPNLDLYFRDCVIGGPGAFIVVAQTFEAFASAIRRKLILEIAGLTPEDAPRPAAAPAPTQAAPAIPRLQLTQLDAEEQRRSPPCDIGEQILRARTDDF